MDGRSRIEKSKIIRFMIMINIIIVIIDIISRGNGNII